MDVHGNVQRSGQLSLVGDIDPWHEQPTFDIDLQVERLHARELNPFLRAYAGVDAEAGNFFLYTEVHARDGRFHGYVKPMVEHLSLFRFGEDGDAIDPFGDFVVQRFQDLFENHGTDRFATRVGISGSFDAPGVNALEAVLGILSNSFIRAFEHGLEDGGGWAPEPAGRRASSD